MVGSHLGNGEKRLELVREYFTKVGAGDPTLADLFSEDMEMHFPKFGIGRGKRVLAEFAKHMSRVIAEIGHHTDHFKYVISDDTIVVEGTEFGRLRDGRSWPDGHVSQGRFCSVFEFDGLLIKRMFIYVDPDFGSDDSDRIEWLRRHPVAPGLAATQAASSR